MPQKCKGPPADEAGEPKELHSFTGECLTGSPNRERVQATIAGLQREFIAECLRIAALKASHAADNLELGDDLSAERDIGIVVQHIREGASAFRELQKLEGAA